MMKSPQVFSADKEWAPKRKKGDSPIRDQVLMRFARLTDQSVLHVRHPAMVVGS